MSMNKHHAAMIFLAISGANEPEKIVEMLGEEKAIAICEKVTEISENTTPNERKIHAQQLLSMCCDCLLDN